MNIIERVKAPTPKFFRVLRTIGLSLAAASGALLAAPIALPAAIVSLAGYIAVAGAVVTAVSQTAVDGEDSARNGGGNPIDPKNMRNAGGSPSDPLNKRNGGGMPMHDPK